MEILTPVILLATIFCGLVSVLFLYGRILNYLYKRSPPVNKRKLEEWILKHEIILPSVDCLVKEFNQLADGVRPVEGGVVSAYVKLGSVNFNKQLI